ncbi:hypothetical protein HAPAU_37680 [Halalkalicoccus paucihalophilus]|uniref:Uncharacterized protein n=1 Tax=Halalkalicoccus paucihalophilus TaxID=1008153 RepID=A0A151A912_9EURY|nr:hypothetical protein HAPAU_37680 [Halalkalicoccus paucihalophilus]
MSAAIPSGVSTMSGASVISVVSSRVWNFPYVIPDTLQSSSVVM